MVARQVLGTWRLPVRVLSSELTADWLTIEGDNKYNDGPHGLPTVPSAEVKRRKSSLYYKGIMPV